MEQKWQEKASLRVYKDTEWDKQTKNICGKIGWFQNHKALATWSEISQFNFEWNCKT